MGRWERRRKEDAIGFNKSASYKMERQSLRILDGRTEFNIPLIGRNQNKAVSPRPPDVQRGRERGSEGEGEGERAHIGNLVGYRLLFSRASRRGPRRGNKRRQLWAIMWHFAMRTEDFDETAA